MTNNMIMVGLEMGYDRVKTIKETMNISDLYGVYGTKDEYLSLKGLFTQMISFWEIIHGDYSSCPLNYEHPVDDDVFALVSDTSLETLQMFGRMGDEVDKYEIRKNIYLRHLKYWNSFLAQKKITHAFFLQIPHEIYDFIIYSLCNRYGIKVCMGDWASDYLFDRGVDLEAHRKYFFSSLRLDDPYFSRILNDLNEKYKHNDIDIELPRGMREQFEINQKKFSKNNHKYSSRLSSYTYHEIVGRDSELRRMFYKIDGGILNKIRSFRSFRKRVNETRELMEYYDKLAVLPDLKAKYIYVPLQCVPECTVSPQGGGIYADQVTMIDVLAGSVPNDYLIYVIEHPCQTCFGRDKSFYDRCVSIPNVRLIKEDVDNYYLINNAVAISILTSSMGYEAQYYGVPVMMFGHFITKYAPGVIHVRTVEDCKKALTRIEQNGISWNLRDVEIFLKLISCISTRLDSGSLDEFGMIIKRVYEEQE